MWNLVPLPSTNSSLPLSMNSVKTMTGVCPHFNSALFFGVFNLIPRLTEPLIHPTLCAPCLRLITDLTSTSDTYNQNFHIVTDTRGITLINSFSAHPHLPSPWHPWIPFYLRNQPILPYILILQLCQVQNLGPIHNNTL